ncbi:MAG: diaminopimelate epimerase [Francisellaceae bacterium]|jgi:diaminopimelate epimerase|nr:diaminopimelate epimerase [Francisellaceae bacterium]MBT6207304.1 diaminopimelate epimerase [Francisellaceae bacterium]MBT6538888.1 diaminopimelate epimerase [Francisellaceae bacterium]
MIVNFTKMHSLGNDFVIIDLISQYIKLYPGLIERITERTQGIGCDQLLTLEPPTKYESDFYYRIFNQDGNEVEQCGNGARCLAQNMLDLNLTNKNKLIADCKGGSASLHILKNRQTSVCFNDVSNDINTLEISCNQGNFELHCVNLGNPHAVIFVDADELANIAELTSIANTLSASEYFPNGINIGFCQILNNQEINLRVFERGVGFTSSCGTGALAATLCSFSKGLTNNQIKVHFEPGYLKVQYHSDKKCALMAGPTNTVFQGSFRL